VAGTPEWQACKTWLMANPNATPREIMISQGCAFGTARRWHLEWRRLNSLAPAKVPKTPNPRPPMRVVRTPVDELPTVKREEVMRRLRLMHEYIDLTNQRLITHHTKLKPNEHAQLTQSIRAMSQSAQTLCDSYPGLSALFEGEKEADGFGEDDDLATIHQLYGSGA